MFLLNLNGVLRRSPAALTYEYLGQRARYNGDVNFAIFQNRLNRPLQQELLNGGGVSASGGFVVERKTVTICAPLIASVFGQHYFGICVAFLSVVLCIWSGSTHVQLIDDSFFKSLGMLLAVLVSVRTRNGVVRREQVLSLVLAMGSTARDVVELVASVPDLTVSDDERLRTRVKLLNILEFTFARIAHWLEVRELGLPPERLEDSTPTWQGPDIDDLPAEYRKAAARLGSMPFLGMPPRPLLYFLREVCDKLWAIPEDLNLDRISKIRRWHKLIDIELDGLLKMFDVLSTFLEEVQPRQMTWLVDLLIYTYTSLYPWCVRHESALMLTTTTLGMCFVFLGLNTLTCELEDPLLRHSHGFNLSLIFEQVFRNIECEEAAQIRCRHCLRNLDPEEVCEQTCQDFVQKEMRTHGPFFLGSLNEVELSQECAGIMSLRPD